MQKGNVLKRDHKGNEEAPPVITINKTFDPSQYSMSELLSHVESSFDGFAAIRSFFKNITNSPFQAEQSCLRQAVELLIVANMISQSHYKPEMQQVGEQQRKLPPEEQAWRAFQVLGVKTVLAAQVNNLRISATQMGTHTAKSPNTAAAGRTSFFADPAIVEAAKNSPLVSSMSTWAKLRVGGGGNAAQNGTTGFLMMSLRVDDEIINVADSIRTKGEIFTILEELGIDRADLNQMSDSLQAQFALPDEEPLGDNIKCLLWPTGDGRYHQISPVHPFAMHVEVMERLSRRTGEGKRIPTNNIKIGGANPQNSSVVNSKYQGVHRLLKSVPPKVVEGAEQKTFKLKMKDALSPARIGEADSVLKDLEKKLKRPNTNAQLRAAIDRLIRKLVVRASAPYLEARAILSDNVGQEIELISNLDVDSRQLLLDGYTVMTNRDYFHRSIAKHAMGRLPESDAIVNAFRRVANEFLAACFQGVSK